MEPTPSPNRNVSGPGRADASSQTGRHSRSLVEDVVTQVTRQITSGALVPGEKLPTEQRMMQTLGVSRTVIREAISRLQAAELVETRHGIGTFVRAAKQIPSEQLAESSIVTMYDVLDMLEFRISLETQAAGLAAMKRTEEDLAVFADILAAFVARVREGGNAIQEDLDFHFHLGKSTGNRYFEEVYRFIGQNTIPRTRLKIAQYTADTQETYLMRNHLEHQAVFDAIARQDAESAQAAMRIHLVNSRERLRRALELEGHTSL
ncbi:GntR family transcription regulator protein [uncultured delta proteobacterium]|uniref:GntR family transcription regulator protein n=1 Tax=uncultured delta proteobacterium TaxID=34034 RepID=A0A212KA53_9DELT|nr:GntR family transcription regulator protein [uncultured delta proteobacterium]